MGEIDSGAHDVRHGLLYGIEKPSLATADLEHPIARLKCLDDDAGASPELHNSSEPPGAKAAAPSR